MISHKPKTPVLSKFRYLTTLRKPSLMVQPAHHNEIEFNFLPEGSVTYLLDGRKVTLTAGALFLFWAATPHQIIHFSGEQPYFVTTVPLDTFLHWQLPENFVQSLMQGNMLMSVDKTRRASDLRLFQQWTVDFVDQKTGIDRAVSLEMQARITRMALNYGGTGGG